MTLDDIALDCIQQSWTAPATALNAQAVATKAAVSLSCHVITKIRASFNAVDVGIQLRLVSDLGGASETTYETYYTSESTHELDYGDGLVMPNGKSVSAVLEASGSPTITGSVTLIGFTTSNRIHA